MEPQISGEEKQAIEQIYNYASDLIIRQNRPDYEVVHLLQDKGLNESNAQLIVDKIVSQVNNAKRSKAKKDILYGALWCVGGIIITVGTYSAASNGGGSYVITWGAILFGGIQLFKGIINY
jgi:hypothetical protein